MGGVISINGLVGGYSLLAAVVIAGLTVVASLGAARLGEVRFHRMARWGIYLTALMFAVASGAMARALYMSDFSIAYVASYTERALPLGYKLSAFWAGQEGSLLFWALVLAMMVAAYAFIRRHDHSRQQAITLLVLAVTLGFFASLLTFVDADKLPFSPRHPVPADGMGLNPMLQNIGMIAHPPTLFIGYAGFTIPFALMIAALVCGSLESWIGIARRWILFAWIFLTIGIILGAQWAYVELGWGGYWAWDPVENASLLPWLTGTALLHSIFVQQQRSMFRLWNVLLAGGTFILCIFGTYITRSGIIQSVHAFQPSLIATFFLTFMILCTIACLALIIFRWRRLGQQPAVRGKGDAFEKAPAMQGLISREGAVLLGNSLLVLMTVLTLLGTMSPVINERLTGRAITMQQNFYNTAVLPLALVMLLIMGAAPMLGYGLTKLGDLLRCVRVPLAISFLAAIVVSFIVGIPIPEDAPLKTVVRLMLLGPHSCTFVVAMTICCLLADFIQVLRARMRNVGGNLLGCAFAAIDASHRRYGGHMAHLGMAMIVAGIAGSSLFGQKESAQLVLGERTRIGSYEVSLDAVNRIRGANFTGMEAVVTLTTPAGKQHVLKPQIREYAKSRNGANAEVALMTNLAEDVYISALGFGSESSATIQVMINPLVLWIWIGGLVMTLGGVWAMLPTLMPAGQRVEVKQAVPVTQGV